MNKQKIRKVKNGLIIIFSFISVHSIGQTRNTDSSTTTPYQLSLPAGWAMERFSFPIGFAPQILYSGVEDIRFAPGWAKPTSEEYWTYAFLWYLDSLPMLNEAVLTENVRMYYTGLISANTNGNADTVKTFFRKTISNTVDINTYTGTIEMMDYMQQKRIVLNCMVHYKLCSHNDKIAVFFELSPQPFAHKNWLILHELWTDFKCK